MAGKDASLGQKKNDRWDNAGGSVVRLRTASPTTEELVAGLKLGDPESTAALVDRFGVSIDRRVWRLLGADSEHHDVVQQVYTQILESIGKLREPAAFADWVTRVTVNVVRNELRRRKYRRIVRLDPESACGMLDPVDPEDRVRVIRAYRILETMKADARIYFVMRFIEGAELREVAAATGCSLATAKRRIGRARDAFLKKAMRDPFLASLAGKGGGR